MSQKYQFPKDFVFGVADADLQVISEDLTIKNEHSESTMWKYFAEASGKVHKNTSPINSVDRYNRWKEDIKIMKELGIKEYRTSISMSRTLKKDGSVNSKAIEWYKTYFAALNNAGIRVFATLYHWELPQYLSELGGWTNKTTIDVFLKHVEAVVNNLDEFIDEYFILNEPWCSSILSYYLGVHAPGNTNLRDALQASHHLLLAQGRALRLIKSISPNAKVSTVYNVEPAYAATSDSKDVLAAKYSSGSFNEWFMDPLYKGTYPDFMLELYGEDAPEFTEEEMEEIRVGDQLETLGLNYYLGREFKYNESERLKCKTTEHKESIRNDLGWVIFVPPLYSEGLYDILNQVYHSYKDYGLKKIYITENGLALNTPWDKKSKVVEDDKRIMYYSEHLKQLHKAILKGIPVTKFFLWTLMDNYEWAEGYRPDSCFGIIHIDRETKERVWKKSAKWYSNVVKKNEFEY